MAGDEGRETRNANNYPMEMNWRNRLAIRIDVILASDWEKLRQHSFESFSSNANELRRAYPSFLAEPFSLRGPYMQWITLSRRPPACKQSSEHVATCCSSQLWRSIESMALIVSPFAFHKFRSYLLFWLFAHISNYLVDTSSSCSALHCSLYV